LKEYSQFLKALLDEDLLVPKVLAEIIGSGAKARFFGCLFSHFPSRININLPEDRRSCSEVAERFPFELKTICASHKLGERRNSANRQPFPSPLMIINSFFF